MSSLIGEVVRTPVLAVLGTVVAVLVAVHVEDITEVSLVEELLPDNSICVDLEGGILITVIRQRTDFESAKQLCRDESSELARIDTRELYDVVESFLLEDRLFSVWVGMIPSYLCY